MYGSGLIKGLGITLHHWFEKKDIVQYPEQPANLMNRYRGCLQYDIKDCIACEACIKACPNDALAMKIEKDPTTKKRKVMQYKIDVQYCMFCGMCTEACPKDCLSFNHNYEMAKYRREDIAIIYDRPPEMDKPAPGAAPQLSPEEAEKRQKKITALASAYIKSPEKGLIKIVEDEEKRKIMAEIITEDNSKAEKLAACFVDDPEKAKAFVERELKIRAGEPVEPEAAPVDEEAEKRTKKITALTAAFTKNPVKGLAKILESEEDRTIMADLIAADNSKASKIAELFVDDPEKAKKVAGAFVMKEKKNRAKAAEAGEGGNA